MTFISFNRPRNKFGAQKTDDGFPSKLESAVHQLLVIREKAGEIRNICRQVRVELTRSAIATKIDFSFIDVHTEEQIFCEAKGIKTERYRLIEKLWRCYGPGPLQVWGGNYKKPQLMNTIVPGAE